MTKKPKISIVIPVYNGANYLREAIDSALAQTYTNKEIIVVNDGSNDNGLTEQIALSYGKKLRYFNKPNGGVASALNKAIEEMTGEYFSWLSHDDLYFPNKLAVQIEALLATNNPKTVIYSNFVFFQDNEEDYLEIKLPHIPVEQFRYFLTVKSAVHGCTLLIPKTALIEYGGFNEALRYGQDYDLWFRMAEQYQFVHLPQYLVKGRQHIKQDSIKMKAAAVSEYNGMNIEFIKNLTLPQLLFDSKTSPSLAYAAIAAAQQQRGFNKSRNYAQTLALKNIFQGSLLQGFKTISLLLKINTFGYLLFKLYPSLFRFRYSLQQVRTTVLFK
jgi:glycosyltransferase involved in cell wall biosynthesis